MDHPKPTADDRDYLTTREAAELLGVALRTAQLWVEAGTLRAWKTAGGHRRITRESVAALLEQQKAARNVAVPPITEAKAYHVLVVDDDAMAREVMVMMIRSWNLSLTVGTAEDGFAALLSIGETRPDLLLTDLIMPGMDGYRMIRHLRAMPESRLIEIIAITGQELKVVDQTGLLPPDVPVLGKPVSYAKLKALVQERMLQRRR
jgi:excisionase family DNA binding protein